MPLCLGERLDDASWTGLPLGHFEPPGHESALPVAASQDTLFVWRDGASAAVVHAYGATVHCKRRTGIVDLMADGQEATIKHLTPESPGECLLVSLPPGMATIPGRPPWTAGLRRSIFGYHDEHLVMLARSLERQCLEGQPFGRVYTESISLALMSYVSARYGAVLPGTSDRSPGRLSPSQQRLVQDYIEAQLSSDISLANLAKLCDYSVPYFARAFRHSFGVSVHGYVNYVRIEKSRRLLREDHLSLSEVAASCGFSSHSYFSATFLRLTGCSPSTYRNATRS